MNKDQWCDLRKLKFVISWLRNIDPVKIAKSGAGTGSTKIPNPEPDRALAKTENK